MKVLFGEVALDGASCPGRQLLLFFFGLVGKIPNRRVLTLLNMIFLKSAPKAATEPKAKLRNLYFRLFLFSGSLKNTTNPEFGIPPLRFCKFNIWKNSGFPHKPLKKSERRWVLLDHKWSISGVLVSLSDHFYKELFRATVSFGEFLRVILSPNNLKRALLKAKWL